MTSYNNLNALVNLYDAEGHMQLGKDREAARAYFLEHVNPRTMFFHDLREKIDYLVENGYYESETLDQYSFEEIKSVFRHAYSFKFRFKSFLGSLKFFTSYALKTFDGENYLERYEDRVSVVALYLARGNVSEAKGIVTEIIEGRLQPATPTFLNAGRKQRGEMVSCFLLDIQDNMESIGRAITSSLQLSKRGGGVALCLSNIREEGAPIKNIENQSSGIIPVMKLLEDAFSYANQLGQRQGAGAVYLNAHHPDIMKFLDTKRENADEKLRIKTLSLGVVIPDVTFELARANRDMYLFSPYDVERIYGKPFAYVNVSEVYDEMVDNPEIRKKKINARDLLQTIAEVQFESGYPYLMFEDTVNRAHNNEGKVILSNLCSEIAQRSTPSVIEDDLTYSEVGQDIQCNLGSLNVANVMASGDIQTTVQTAVRALTAVADLSDITSAPTVRRGNETSRAIGLGQMNLHGYFAEQWIEYGSPESVKFTDAYFRAVTFYAIEESMRIAKETGSPYADFEKSRYASGEFFDDLISENWEVDPSVEHLFEGIDLPTNSDWETLKHDVMEHGLYNAYLQAVPPTGSISYLNHATASIHPVTAPVEIRKEGKLGRVYYPAPGLTEDNMHLFKDAYEIGPEKIIDVYSAAQKYVDQSLSLTLFFTDDATTRDLNRAQIYAWRKGIKTLYYVRLRQMALSGTEVEGCVSCAL